MPDHSGNIPKLWQLLFHLEIDRVSRQWLEKYASSCPFLDQRTSTTVHYLFVACDTVLIITIHSSSIGRSTFDVFVARIERSSSQSRPLQSQDTCRPCNFISKAWTHSRHLLRDVDHLTFPLSACRVWFTWTSSVQFTGLKRLHYSGIIICMQSTQKSWRFLLALVAQS